MVCFQNGPMDEFEEILLHEDNQMDLTKDEKNENRSFCLLKRDYNAEIETLMNQMNDEDQRRYSVSVLNK